MNKPYACLGHSNPAAGFCACDCGELAQAPQRNSAGQDVKTAAPVMPDFKPSLLERALFPVVGIWNVLVGVSTILKCVTVFVFGTLVMPTTARRIILTIKYDADDFDHWMSILFVGLLLYPVAIAAAVIVALTVGAAGTGMSDWSDAREHQRALCLLFSTYVQPFLIPLAITNALSLLYEIGRTKRKFARAPQTPSVV